MLKQIFSWKDVLENDNEHIRASSFVLALYVSLIPIANGLSGLVGKVNIVNYIIILYFFLTAIELFRKPEPLLRKELTYIYLFFLYSAASFFWNGDMELNWGVRTTFTAVLLFFFSAGRCYSAKERRLFVTAILIGAVAAIIVASANFQSVVERRLEIRVCKEIDPNFFCGDLCAALALMMTLGLDKKYHWMVVPISFIFIFFFFASSRGAMLIGLSLFTWWMGAATFKKKVYVPILALFLFAILLFILTRPMVTHLLIRGEVSKLIVNRTNPETLIEDNGAGRLQIWLEAWKCFINSSIPRKIFGNGLVSFPKAVNYVAPGHQSEYSSHNIYINALIEGGIVGFILQLAAFLQIFIYSIKKRSLFGSMTIIALALEGLFLDAQFSRSYSWAFTIAAIYEGGKSFEILRSSISYGDCPGI